MSDESGGDRPSKSARKREFAALQALAEQMAALSDRELERLGVGASLRDAIALVRPMRPSGARNRQLRHCVKFMDDGDLAEVRAYLADRHSARVAHNRAFHEVERWRDRLIAGGDPVLEELFDRYEFLDRQRVRQLCRDAGREREAGKSGPAARRLFRYLRDALIQ